MMNSNIQQREIDALQISLQREKNLRKVEHLKSSQTEQRLRRQLKLLLEETDQQRQTIEEMRIENERDVKNLTDARGDVLKLLNETESKLAVYERGGGIMTSRNEVNEQGGGGGGESKMWKRKCELLQSNVEALQAEVSGLKNELSSRPRETPPASDGAVVIGDDNNLTPQKRQRRTPTEESAPPAVMSELNKTRSNLSHSQRRERIHSRKIESLEQKLSTMTQLKEKLKVTCDKNKTLEEELREWRMQRHASQIVTERWEEWRRGIEEALELKSRRVGGDNNAPPEVATIVRHLRRMKAEEKKAEEGRKEVQSQLEACQRRTGHLETQVRELTSNVDKANRDKAESERELKLARSQNEKTAAQLNVLRMEAESMRLLLKTFDKQETSTSKTTASGASSRGLEVSLDAAREEIKIITSARDEYKKDLERVKKDKEVLTKEHDRVLEKFGKLRDALMKEREKAELAEQRACQAETLAGKGAYNTDTTRVLHLQSNPFTEALRAKYEKQIAEFKQKIDRLIKSGAAAGSGASADSSPSASSILDAQKVNARLKENFKQQIGLFREGVYLLTGFKIDMYSDTDRPRFKVRSMYAENEDDHLMFIWPHDFNTSSGGVGSVTSLDLLDSAFAQTVSHTDSFAYVTQFKSIPGFMASLTLNLFEKQTVVGG